MAKRLIITGATASGKTYKSIMSEIKEHNRFIYCAPCRQLVYESYIKYGNYRTDLLTTGEIKLGGENLLRNIFGVYESITPEMVKGCDTLIIDEAHFIKDEQRGQTLLNLIDKALKLNKNIKLVTATKNFELKGFRTIVLKPFCTVPEKKEINFEEAYENIKKGMQTIWFVPSISKASHVAWNLQWDGIKAVAMESSMTPAKRLKTQIAFANKEVQVVVCTNLLAQGVNFECQNLIVEDDYFNNQELIQQKLGRLGRPGTLEGVNEVYYSIHKGAKTLLSMPKEKNQKIVVKKDIVDKTYIKEQFDYVINTLRAGDYLSSLECEDLLYENTWTMYDHKKIDLSHERFYDIKRSIMEGTRIPIFNYNHIKYCLSDIKNLSEDDFSPWSKDLLQRTKTIIKDEENSLREIILEAMGVKVQKPIEVTAQEVEDLIEGIEEAGEPYSFANSKRKEKIMRLKSSI